MQNKNRHWTKVKIVMALLVRPENGKGAEVLLGMKGSGNVAGYVVPPGGHVDKSDRSRLHAVRRETREETPYIVIGRGLRVAELRIRIKAKRELRIVHVIKFRRWRKRSPRSTFDKEEFRWMRFFPLAKVPWKKLIPRDEEWLREVLLERKRLLVRIHCGRDRLDVRRVTPSPLRSSGSSRPKRS